jgi:hypothetical protein
MNITQARQAHRLQTAGGWLALTVLHSPLRFLLESAVAELAYVGSRTRRIIRLPVMYAQAGDRVAVLAGGAHRKTWWRHFRRPRPLQLCLGGRLWYGTGAVASPGTPQFHAALNLYRQRFPQVHYRPGDQLVAITLHTYP